MENHGPSISEIIAIVSLLILAGTTILTTVRGLLKDRSRARAEIQTDAAQCEVRHSGIYEKIAGVEVRLNGRLDETRQWVSSIDKKVNKVSKSTDEVAFNLQVLMEDRGLTYHKLPNGDRS